MVCNLQFMPNLKIMIDCANFESRDLNFRHLLVALALCDSIFLVFATLEVTPASVRSLSGSSNFNTVYTHLALFIRTLASTFYKASVLYVKHLLHLQFIFEPDSKFFKSIIKWLGRQTPALKGGFDPVRSDFVLHLMKIFHFYDNTKRNHPSGIEPATSMLTSGVLTT